MITHATHAPIEKSTQHLTQLACMLAGGVSRRDLHSERPRTTGEHYCRLWPQRLDRARFRNQKAWLLVSGTWLTGKRRALLEQLHPKVDIAEFPGAGHHIEAGGSNVLRRRAHDRVNQHLLSRPDGVTHDPCARASHVTLAVSDGQATFRYQSTEVFGPRACGTNGRNPVQRRDRRWQLRICWPRTLTGVQHVPGHYIPVYRSCRRA